MTNDMIHYNEVKTCRVFGHQVRTLLMLLMVLGGGEAMAQVTIHGSVFGGGNDADVMTNTVVNISKGQVYGNVYGGGNLGDVGTIDKSDPNKNYLWTINAQGVTTETYNNTGKCEVTISGSAVIGNGTLSSDHGNVFGGGKGYDVTYYPEDNTVTFYCEKGMVYTTDVKIEDGTVKGNVYGGGQIARVESHTIVTIGEESGDGDPEINGSVFGAGKGAKTHGYSALVRGNPVVTIQGNAKILGTTEGENLVEGTGNVYGGGEIASVGKHKVKTSASDTNPLAQGLPLGMPYTLENTNLGECTVNVKGSAVIAGNVYGAGKGIVPVTYDEEDKPTRMGMTGWEPLDEGIYNTFVHTLALTTDTYVTIGGTWDGSTVTASGAPTISGSVYGGSENGFVQYHTNVTIAGGSIVNNVYGGGQGLDSFADAGFVKGNSTVTVSGGSVGNDVYGGGKLGYVKESVEVNITGGVVTHDVYGGGSLANTNTANWDATANENQGGWADGKTSASNTTTVSLTGGSVRDVYGGALGDATHTPYVYGDVLVELNGHIEGTTITRIGTSKPGCIVERIFGANNLKGTPKGHVRVNVLATQTNGTADISTKNGKHDDFEAEDATTTYDVKAVYGGGNLAAYEPTDALLDYTTNKATVDAARTEVYIEGCDYTSIKQVYAGGNAASVPASYVHVSETYEIEEVFGGGNGKDAYQSGLDGKYYKNPGANVGYYNYTHWTGTGESAESPFTPVDNTDPDASTKENRITNYSYGSGIATTEIVGGTIHAVYGGSNEKGNIRKTALSHYEDLNDDCPVVVSETYGGGKNAPIDGEIQMNLDCVRDMPMVFGGAKNANVNNNIVLNITNGTFGKVFGGNNEGGLINGSITVNIIESGCKPINITELYGGGYLASYSIYGYNTDNTPRTKAQYDALSAEQKAAEGLSNPYADPRINVISATSIGDIYGGGYRAIVVGNPRVNVNMTTGKVFVTKKEKTNEDDGTYAFIEGEGADQKTYVYKDAAGTIYDPNVVTPEETKLIAPLALGTIGNIYGGGYQAEIDGNTFVEIGTGQWLNADNKIETEDASGNIYTYEEKTPETWKWYDANGDEVNTAPTPARAAAKITGNVYGGGNEADITGDTQVNISTQKNGASYASVTLAANATGVSIDGDVFGAGKGVDSYAEVAKVEGSTTIVIGGGEIKKSVYGGGELSQVGGDTDIRVMGGTIGTTTLGGETYGNVYGGGKGNKDSKNGTIDNATLVAAGLIKGNTNITVSGGSIIHNIYGGGAHGSVGTFVYDDDGVITNYTSGGKAKITIEGGTIGTDGHENGMIFGSSRGDVGAPNSIHDKLAWVYQTEVKIGTEGQGANTTNPAIKGSVYGSGENGHTYQNASVTIYSGKVGITETMSTDPDGEGGAKYPYRGNVYGGGCGTDTYDDNGVEKNNPKAGFVGGTATVLIEGGHVVRNLYGAGAMGSVDGLTTVTINSGTIGAENSGGGYVYASARGEDTLDDADQAYAGATALNINGGTVWGDAFGGGRAGITKGAVTVNLTGGEVKGDVYGGGALAQTNTDYDATSHPSYTTTVNLGNSTATTGTTIDGNLYGGGLGRIASGSDAAIAANVYGPVTVTVTKGLANNVFGCNNINGSPQSTVTVNIEGTNEPTANIPLPIHNVYGGGNQAAYTYTDEDHPQNLIVNITGGTIDNVFGGGLSADVNGGINVNVSGGTIKNDVYGGGSLANTNTANWSGDGSFDYEVVDDLVSQTYKVKAVDTGTSVAGLFILTDGIYTEASGNAVSGTTYYEIDQKGSSVGGYYARSGLEGSYVYTLVTTGAAVSGTTYCRKIVSGNWANESGPVYNTNVSLTGGLIGNAYGGGLGRLYKDGVDAVYTAVANGTTLTSGNTYYTSNAGDGEFTSNGTEVANGSNYYTLTTPAAASVSAVAAMVYGDVLVTVNKDVFDANKGVTFTQETDKVTYGEGDNQKEYIIPLTGRVFGCNNQNGTPTGNVRVEVHKTRQIDANYNLIEGHGSSNRKYPNEMQAVYGGGNLSDYLPAEGKGTSVFIDDCEETSIEKVYGGGNSASVPSTNVTINACYDIGYAFGGGNGGDLIYKNNEWHENEGAIVIGHAQITPKGGKIGQVFGGSDAKGVCGSTTVDLAKQNESTCPLVLTRIYGAGNEADVADNVNMIISGCASNTKTIIDGQEVNVPTEIEYVYGGSYNAHITGDVTLTITSGIFKYVYGGNDRTGSIGGKITVNIEERDECNPIIIEHLLGGGNEAPYPGTLRSGTEITTPGKIQVNVKSATYIGDIFGGSYKADVNGDTEVNINMTKGLWAGAQAPEGYSTLPNVHQFKYAKVVSPVTENIISYYEKNGNTYTETHDSEVQSNKTYYAVVNNYVIADSVGFIGEVYGGGNQGVVRGNSTVNIGTSTTVPVIDVVSTDSEGKITNITYNNATVLGAHITGDVYGGGNLADVRGNTAVNICAKYSETYSKYEAVAEGTEKVTIGGNVYGGGKGANDTFTCEKGMVGVEGSNTGAQDDQDLGTHVRIGNGTVGTLDDEDKLVDGTGNVYGGGKVGRVEFHSVVTIGLTPPTDPTGVTSAPEILGKVFGGGKGAETHGYAALLRGHTNVTVQQNAKVRNSVYGGGEISTIGRFWIKNVNNNVSGAPDAPEDLPDGMPYALKDGGRCTVNILGNAEIGPEAAMTMPQFAGNVFGAGSGFLPKVYDYSADNDDHRPKRVSPVGDDYFKNEDAYMVFIETQALADETYVTIGGNAFVKGSVYGGSENGRVLNDTHVNITGGQIGCSKNRTNRLADDISTVWNADYDASTTPDLECPSWDYDKADPAPYDPFAQETEATYDYTLSNFDIITDKLTSSDGGKRIGKDGHTYYGNVFGGGSGKDPYAPGRWHRKAGAVGGDTFVNITGGHILTSVYGGNEHTDVGTYAADNLTPRSGGKCIVNMTGGTLGVPRTLEQIAAHPVTCYLFGAGKGDQRIFFNTWTNVISTEVNISGNARIYGSTFGGGEDGHVMNDAVTNIGDVTIKTGKDANGDLVTDEVDEDGLVIGTWGTSYVDGNVFGGGRGFSGEALTAGTVGGNATVTINGGTMLGSIYGGGRLASVGTYFTDPSHALYGQFQEDETTGENPKTYGHVTVTISGGTIGNENAAGDGAKYSGNVFGGSMGRITLLDGSSINPMWPELAQVKTAAVTISGSPTITRNVYGGGEYGTVRENATTTISSGTIGGNVFGGGYGSDDHEHTTPITVHWNNNNLTYAYTPMQWAGTVGGDTQVNISGGTLGKNVYGGGELASVGIINYQVDAKTAAMSANSKLTDDNIVYYHHDPDSVYVGIIKHADIEDPAKKTEKIYGFGLSWPYEFTYVPCKPDTEEVGGQTNVNITGGTFVTSGDTDTGYIFGGGKGKVWFGATQATVDSIAQQRYTEAFCANVRETEVTIGTGATIRTVYGGGEDGHVYEDANVIINGGHIVRSVFGGGKGTGQYTTKLWDTDNEGKNKTYSNPEGELVYSWTAGKVYGNTKVTMKSGNVDLFIFGGGNLASVGKGNYAGGLDDYFTAGYGETLIDDESTTNTNEGLLWAATTGFNPDTEITDSNKPTSMADYFLSSGKSTVNIFGGTVGPTSGTGDTGGIPNGSVFGGSRGLAAKSVNLSPRYRYMPDFFLGYVNKAVINIGGYRCTTADGSYQVGDLLTEKEYSEATGLTAGNWTPVEEGPRIYGSVYGGGQDGHVRNSTEVKIFSGNISGQTGDTSGRSGHVFGAGSGIGTYGDNNYCNNSSGSVTCTTLVEVKGGSIAGNVYGGGALASVGPRKIPTIPFNELNNTDEEYPRENNKSHGSMSFTKVSIQGGSIGGSVYGASRGPAYSFLTDAFRGGISTSSTSAENQYNPTKFATSIWTEVDVTGGTIAGSVYGGGEMGQVKESTVVKLTGGTIANDAYGGGKGTINAESSWDIAADIGGNTTVELNNNNNNGDAIGSQEGCSVKRIFGCNDLNGTPKGHVKVHVYATQHPNRTDNPHIEDKYVKYDNVTNYKPSDYLTHVYEGKNLQQLADDFNIDLTKTPYTTYTTTIGGSGTDKEKNDAIESIRDSISVRKYDVEAVYGGGNLAAYVPTDPTNTEERTEVIIDGCGLTSIKQVYGGGNAASTPATLVRVNGCYEIDEIFGGGNGKDIYQDARDNEWYGNPGANVGYYNYTTYPKGEEQGSGSKADPWKAIDDTRYDDKDKRLAATALHYGSGTTEINVTGGRVHIAYGGSNTRGNVRVKAESLYQESGTCTMIVDKTYGAGKNADIDAQTVMNMDCVTEMDRIFGGSTNADVNNDVYLKITNGKYRQVFGGNDTNGAINGSITVVIEESGCTPIEIDELYGGGYLAPYSIYGYEKNNDGSLKALKAGETGALSEENKRLHPNINVISATKIGDIYGGGYQATVVGDPRINVNMKAGYIAVSKKEKTDDHNYGEGYEYEEGGKIYIYVDDKPAPENGYKTAYKLSDLTPMTEDDHDTKHTHKYMQDLGYIENIYGGGYEADIIGDTYVEIGTGKWIPRAINDETKKYENQPEETLTRDAATITGNVYGGGKGNDDNYTCDKAMIGEEDSDKGSTHVLIENGTVGTLENGTLKAGTGNVYGGGMIGRVEKDTEVTIGKVRTAFDTDEAYAAYTGPTIYGSVFGAGKGVSTHGYSGLVRGDSKVTIQTKTKVQRSVYGGGEMATVGKFYVKNINDKGSEYENDERYAHVPTGMPYAPRTGGKCTVIVKDDAEIGTDDMKMIHLDNEGHVMNGEDGKPLPPDDWGHVFGAGKGILAYEEDPKRMAPGNTWEEYTNAWYTTTYGENYDTNVHDPEADYLTFIETLGLASNTEVTISGNAFVKGSVYGGSENGRVLANTHVTIAGGQIGKGKDASGRYDDDVWGDNYTPTTDLECASWPYEAPYAPYDRLALTTSGHEEEYEGGSSTRGGRRVASDGHTFYGNVFGGGSGLYPYKPGKWHRAAGSVGGNTVVDILGGHILTSVYGGNEHTDVGTYGTDGVTPVSGGKCTINMVGGTLGVPRTLAQIAAHPVTCYLFGAGKGDPRTFFNTWTNVKETEVNISGNARIYGSVFGGGEDGHVIENAETNIGGSVTINAGTENEHTYSHENVIIGTTGTSYVDGNVFGAGRGFSGDELTAGSVGGNVTVNIINGTMLGSIYGGGRLASVGIGFNAPTDTQYGQFTEDDITAATYYQAGDEIPEGKEVGDEKTPVIFNKSYGHVTVNISGGTIGNDTEFKTPTAENTPEGLNSADIDTWTDEDWNTWKTHNKIPYTEFDKTTKGPSHTKGGNVFGGSMGRLMALNNVDYLPLWPQLGQVKRTTVNITGGSIKSNVYGGAELGTVRDSTNVIISGGTVGRDAFGGGYGSIINTEASKATVKTVMTVDENDVITYYGYTPIKWAGLVGKESNVNIYGGQVRRNLYGGGEMASVGIINYIIAPKATAQATNSKLTESNMVYYRHDPDSVYVNIIKHDNETNSFALSWPYEFSYIPGYEGTANVTITGGRIGDRNGKDNLGSGYEEDNGDVYAAGKGVTGDRYEMAYCGNVGSTNLIINYKNSDASVSNYKNDLTKACILGAAHGGAENGHVMGDTHVTLEKGLIVHSLYGGGNGKGTYPVSLLKIGAEKKLQPKENEGDPDVYDYDITDYYPTNIYSLTAGKVFGNTYLTMNGGHVVRNVYGGGNIASVGKGNYAGARTTAETDFKLDDYSYSGYGERITTNLWNNVSDDSQEFLNSGKTNVTILGGKVGYVNLDSPGDYFKEGLPYGNVIGGSRGAAAPNVPKDLTPRYHYCPEFFSGYVNETNVIIGTANQDNENAGNPDKAPLIIGSVYGGGQDGHVRRNTHVTVYSGEIGMPFSTTNQEALGGLKTNDGKDNTQWLFRGNVFGAGSGISKYNYTYHYADERGNVSEENYSTSAGSVTSNTTVDINGGIIHRNVYGGGSLASVGAPKIPPTRTDDPDRTGATDSRGVGYESLNRVNIASTIGTPDGYIEGFKYDKSYGGEVYGASRGQEDADYEQYATSVWTEVNLLPGTNVLGNVYGGGDNGMVKHDSEVNVGAPMQATMAEGNINRMGGSKTINVISSTTWKVTKPDDIDWITLTPTEGTGNGTITVTVNGANPDNTTRSATITITAEGGRKQTITVTQDAKIGD